jgi:hypothetical protein
MSLRSRADVAVAILLTLLFLPGRIVEEGLHTLASLPFAEAIRVEIDPRAGTAHTKVAFREGTPAWAIRFAYALPEIAAGIAAAVVIGYWALGGAIWLPSTTLDFVLLGLVGAQYLAIALPSAADADQTPEEVERDG